MITTISAVVTSSHIGSAAEVQAGTYYINGYQVSVANQRVVLDKYYVSPESDYRILALEISEYLKENKINNFSVEKRIEIISEINEKPSIFMKKVLMLLVGNIDLNQSLIDKLIKIPVDSNSRSDDMQNLLLATKLSSVGDYFNSLQILFKIVGEKDLMQLNLIQSYTVLTILKNLGLNDELKNISERILL